MIPFLVIPEHVYFDDIYINDGSDTTYVMIFLDTTDSGLRSHTNGRKYIRRQAMSTSKR